MFSLFMDTGFFPGCHCAQHVSLSDGRSFATGRTLFSGSRLKGRIHALKGIENVTNGI